MFFCDPFGHTDPEHLYNYGDDSVKEIDYVFFHDQEPIQLEAFKDLFTSVKIRNEDISPRPQGRIVVSERGQNLQALYDIYGWKPLYYFFHGWACLDWFRGYHRTFILQDPLSRPLPKKSFMSPNRIIGGDRTHRVLFVYHVLKAQISRANISCPLFCPHEQTRISDVASVYCTRYPDINQVLSTAGLPWTFEGESTQQMASCWLGNFPEVQDSFIYVPTETVYFGHREHLTEKTLKAIALGMPFVTVAAANSLEYLREYGFKTFGDFWDESYDQEADDFLRLEKVVALLKDLDQMSEPELQHLWKATRPVVMHNWNHFYHGGFESVLWNELKNMLGQISV